MIGPFSRFPTIDNGHRDQIESAYLTRRMKSNIGFGQTLMSGQPPRLIPCDDLALGDQFFIDDGKEFNRPCVRPRNENTAAVEARDRLVRVLATLHLVQ